MMLDSVVFARAGILDLPPRYMWGWSPPGGRAPATASGYCGSMSLQTVGLYYGNWLSQDAIRGTSGGHNGKHMLLIGVGGHTSESAACKALKLNCSTWDYNKASNPQHSAFMSWASAAIDAGKPVIMGLYWAEENDADYDHIVPMVGYSEGAVYFNDLHSNTTRRSELPGFASSRQKCKQKVHRERQSTATAQREESWKFCLPKQVRVHQALASL